MDTFRKLNQFQLISMVGVSGLWFTYSKLSPTEPAALSEEAESQHDVRDNGYVTTCKGVTGGRAIF